MLRSNYIIIVDRNKPNSNGKVTAWTDASAQTNILNKQNAHRIYHDMNVPLKNISILYKNMYL
jgi:inhibitor of KinA sporulation pathway (predicted exonuclease)